MIFMVSSSKKEYEVVLNIINELYAKQKNFISMLETPFDVLISA